MKLVKAIQRDGLAHTLVRSVGEAQYRLNKARHVLKRSAFVRTSYGVEMAAAWGDATFEFCVKGAYGTFLSDYISGIDTRFVFLDIGANQGLYSLIAAENTNCAQVLAFEPVRGTFELLTRNVMRNERHDVIKPLNFALSSEDGQANIYIKKNHSGVASLHNDVGSGQAESIELKSTAAIEQYFIPDIPIIVKIDTEGHEQVIMDQLASAAFAPRIRAVFYEIDEEWSSSSALEKATKDLGLINTRKIGSGTHYDVLATR